MIIYEKHPGVFDPSRLFHHDSIEEFENYTPRIYTEETEKKGDKGLQKSQPGAPKKAPLPIID